MFKKIGKVFLAAGLVFLVFSLFSAPLSAFAQTVPQSPAAGAAGALGSTRSFDWKGCQSNLATCAVYMVSYLISLIGNLLTMLAAFLMKEALEFNMDIANSPMIQTGFSIALAIANLGFVLGLIVIAIATILRNQTYGMKQLLWKLVVAAVAVNFSLVIAGVVIDFSNNLAGYFMEQASPNGNYLGFVDSVASSFAPQDLMQPPPAQSDPSSWVKSTLLTAAGPAGMLINGLGGQSTGFEGFVKNILNLVFIIIFIFLVALTFFAAAILLLVRYVFLTILLISMPVAWLTWAFPVMKNMWSKWWNNFFKWCFFAPAMVFFLYLAVLMTQMDGGQYLNKKTDDLVRGDINGVALVNLTGSAAPTNTNETTGKSDQPGPVKTAANMIVVLALAFGGIFAANAFSIAGADIAMKTAKGAGNWAQGQISRGGRTAGRKFASGGRKYNPATGTTTTRFQRWGSKLQGWKVPGAGTMGRAMAGVGTAGAKNLPKDVDQYQKDKLDSLTNEGLIKLANSATLFASDMKAAAVAQELAKRNLLDNPSVSSRINKFQDVSEKTGTIQNLYNNLPSSAQSRNIVDKTTGKPRLETRQEVMLRVLGGMKDASKISSQELKADGDPSVDSTTGLPKDPKTADAILLALNLNNQKLKQIANSDDARQIQNLSETYKRLAADPTLISKVIEGMGFATGSKEFTDLESKLLTQFGKIQAYTNKSADWAGYTF